MVMIDCEPRTDWIAMVQRAVGKYPDSVPDATDASIRMMRDEPAFEGWRESLVRQAVTQMVYDVRHRVNTEIRSATGGYGGPAKVTAGAAVGRVARSLYTYMIAGKTLGNLLGEELSPIADAERSRASGHLFNARLCESLSLLVTKGKTVRDCVGERKLRQVFDALSQDEASRSSVAAA